MEIPFNKPYMTGDELGYIADAVERGHLSGNGHYTKTCHSFLETLYNFQKVLLTTSCTDALEMSAILMDVQPGDEIIMPSFTFVSTANAFVLRGAKIRFCDSYPDHPNIDPECVRELINPKTKAIVVVHYAGVACDMDRIMALANEHNLYVVEDAAQAIENTYKGSPLGGIGDLGTYSFHETKNIQCGEGGALLINNSKFPKRAEIIWEKGTNRSAFFRGEVNKYGWVDIGSSFLPSELNAAFLMAQLDQLKNIQQKRIDIWNYYLTEMSELARKGNLQLPPIPDYSGNNAHMFFMICNSADDRSALIKHYKENGVHAVFHYLSLHKSEYFSSLHDGRTLSNCDYFSDHLLRLPFFYELKDDQLKHIVATTKAYFE